MAGRPVLHVRWMRFSLQVQYAICGAFDLAYHGDGASVQVRVISARQDVPARYLEQIFRRLRQANIVTSKRGPGGGYTLARTPDRVSVREIIEAVEGPLAETLEMEAPSRESPRPAFVWMLLAEQLGTTLGRVSLGELCRLAEAAGIARDDPDAPMYFI